MSINNQKKLDTQRKVVYYCINNTTIRSIGGAGMKIRQLRLKKHWSQKHLADKLNVSQQTVAKWENKKSFPRSELLPELAKILNCKIEELY